MNNNLIPNYKTLTRIPLFRRAVLQSFPFIEEDFDALTDYELLCKVVEYLNKVIEQQNLVGENTDELLRVYLELKKYVDSYLNDETLQPLINNKLDEMASDGTLLNILSDYTNIERVYPTHADLVLDTSNLVNNMKVKTLGYYTLGDGGNAEYIVKTSEPSNTYYEQLDTNLYIQLIHNPIMNVESFGLKSNDLTVDNASKLNSILTIFGNNITLLFKNSTYYFNKHIQIPTSANLIGNNTTFNFTNTDKNTLIDTPDDNNERTINIKNIEISMNEQLFGSGKTYNEGTSIRLFNIINSTIENIKITNTITGNILNGIWLRENCKNVNIKNCNINLQPGQYESGCLWLWCYYSTSIMSNITIENCNLSANTRDEIIAQWGDSNALISNVLYKNCKITETNSNSKVMSISIRNNEKNIIFDSCQFNINSLVSNFMSLTSTNCNIDIINSTFIYDYDNTNSNTIYAQSSNLKLNIENNQFKSNNNYNGNCIYIDDVITSINKNIFKSISNSILTLHQTSTIADIKMTNNIITPLNYCVTTKTSNEIPILFSNNTVNFDSNNDNYLSLIFINRQSGENKGNKLQIFDNNINGKNISIIYGLSYLQIYLINNIINCTNLNLLLRSDETYGITPKITHIINNSFNITTLNDLVNIGDSSPNAIFKNNYVNGDDITDVEDTPSSSSNYWNIYRRLVPIYQIFNAKSNSILGYKKTGTSTWVTINI